MNTIKINFNKINNDFKYVEYERLGTYSNKLGTPPKFKIYIYVYRL